MTAPERRYRDRYFTVPDGVRLHFRDYPGSADCPPLLCLPGLTRNARDFAHLAERHSPEFRVIVLEFRGRGLSEPDPLPIRYNPLTYAAVAGLVIAVTLVAIAHPAWRASKVDPITALRQE